MKKIYMLCICIICIPVMLMGTVGCDGEGQSPDSITIINEGNTPDTSEDNSGDNTDGDTDQDTVETEYPVRMGSYIDSVFTEGTLQVGLSTLSASGSTSVTAYFTDDHDTVLGANEISEVTFTSTCVQMGYASLSSPVEASFNKASTDYRALGCEGTDTITAKAMINGEQHTASTTITVESAIVGSVGFVSAQPNIIALKGTGGANLQESSLIKFVVKDQQGKPIPNKQVDFSLSTYVGGLELTHSYGISDQDGIVWTYVNSGVVSTAIRVNAIVEENGIGTQSDQLVVSTGIPDQDSFSLSTATMNPEAWEYDGEEVEISIRVADQFNNPVPDGTAVAFTTEGGAITSNCETEAGACVVTWVSQQPRPENARVTILATAIGEESFSDVNGSGKFDMYDTDNDGIADTLEPFTDLPEAWRDDDEDGCRDNNDPSTCTGGAGEISNEIFFDYAGSTDLMPNGIFDTPAQEPNGSPLGDGLYNGVLCNDDSCQATNKTLHVRSSLVLVMASSHADIQILEPELTAEGCIDLSGDDNVKVVFSVIGDNGQTMPYETRVTSQLVWQGDVDDIDPYVYGMWPNTNSAEPQKYTVILGNSYSKVGVFDINVKTPKNVNTSLETCVIGKGYYE